MNKKLILVSSLALMLATAGSAMAASANGQGGSNGTGSGLSSQQHLSMQVNHDTNGICDGTGIGSGSENFVDANGDGICDIDGGTHPEDGTGIQYGGRS